MQKLPVGEQAPGGSRVQGAGAASLPRVGSGWPWTPQPELREGISAQEVAAESSGQSF